MSSAFHRGFLASRRALPMMITPNRALVGAEFVVGGKKEVRDGGENGCKGMSN